jgi:2-keto-4-pentenoate hydratase/2-oxohepta-3-ene-1,7-dioic acid hydratase in catechol pathway
LSVIIGRKARRIGKAEVRERIAGLTVMNGLSARDIQLAEHEKNPFFRVHYIGKALTHSAPPAPRW